MDRAEKGSSTSGSEDNCQQILDFSALDFTCSFENNQGPFNNIQENFSEEQTPAPNNYYLHYVTVMTVTAPFDVPAHGLACQMHQQAAGCLGGQQSAP